MLVQPPQKAGHEVHGEEEIEELRIEPHRGRGWGIEAQRAVGPTGIVLSPALLDQHFRFLKRIENVTPQEFLPERPVLLATLLSTEHLSRVFILGAVPVVSLSQAVGLSVFLVFVLP